MTTIMKATYSSRKCQIHTKEHLHPVTHKLYAVLYTLFMLFTLHLISQLFLLPAS